jgi:hypothetical protein
MFHLGRIPNLLSIITTGGLGIWLAKLAGCRCVKGKEAPTSKI